MPPEDIRLNDDEGTFVVRESNEFSEMGAVDMTSVNMSETLRRIREESRISEMDRMQRPRGEGSPARRGSPEHRAMLTETLKVRHLEKNERERYHRPDSDWKQVERGETCFSAVTVEFGDILVKYKVKV